MTSERECFVYIMLPRTHVFVTAGKFVWRADRRGVATGRFVYGRSYLERSDAVAIDPVELKLKRGTFTTARLNGVFGALRDAGPDYWGRRIIERRLGRLELDEIDYLLDSPDDRAGALGFGIGEPPSPRKQFNQTIDLARLQDVAGALVRDDVARDAPDAQQAADLLQLGTSMGGARPKAVVEDDDALWVAKFNRFDDRWNAARVEHGLLRLAAACGINVPPSRAVDVGGRDVLLVRRFDRQREAGNYRRARMCSALTLLQASDESTSRGRWSYLRLAEVLRRVSAKPVDDARELFRRMCFNALVSNTDDHPRNHAVLAMAEEWRLSPAYDLTPSTPVSMERRDLAMTCGVAGRWANRANLLSQSARFLLDRDEAARLYDEIEGIIGERWRPVLLEAGVSPTECDSLAGAFVYPGLHLPLPTS